jgi:hypothetical protein
MGYTSNPNTNPPVMERKSDKMAGLARDYHHNLQDKDLSSGVEQDAAKEAVYNNITNSLTSEETKPLSELLSESEVETALKLFTFSDVTRWSN